MKNNPKSELLGKTYLDNDNYKEAINWFEIDINNGNENLDNYVYLGLSYLLSGDIETAQSVWMSLLLNSNNFHDDLQCLLTILNDMGIYQLQKNNFPNALKIYTNIDELLFNEEEIKPDWGLYYYHFALTLEGLEDKNNAIKVYQKAIHINKYLIDAYNNLGNIYSQFNQLEKAEFIYREGIKINPQYAGTYFNLLLTLKNKGEFKEAIIFATETAKLFPEDFNWQLQQHLFLPIIYHTQEEITIYRQRFTEGLNYLITNLDLSTEVKQKNALTSILNHTNFYLAYQGYNDLDLQKKYGYLVTQITNHNFPQWAMNKKNISTQKQGKIKLGFVCGKSGNRAKWLLQWLENIDKNQFIIYVYIIENIKHNLANKFNKVADFYCCIPDNLEPICDKIYTDNLDILTYTEIGMLPQTIVMGSLKLAPIQCSTIGHPLTTGLDAIDYYISRDLMETNTAQSHYSEKLFLLPNIGMCLKKDSLPVLNKSRQDFNLNKDDTIYLCSQMLFKYLPQHDYLYAEIAQQVLNAKFIFLESYPYLTNTFKQRLNIVFREYNLDFHHYCIFLSPLCQQDYFNLNILADVFLDSLAWSGDNTTREAIACNLPVVTYPSEFMRGRHSCGILKMLGVTQTIANSEQEYITIAVRLAHDKLWAQKIRAKINDNHHRLYHDLECVKALEKFYLSLCV